MCEHRIEKFPVVYLERIIKETDRLVLTGIANCKFVNKSATIISKVKNALRFFIWRCAGSNVDGTAVVAAADRSRDT